MKHYNDGLDAIFESMRARHERFNEEFKNFKKPKLYNLFSIEVVENARDYYKHFLFSGASNYIEQSICEALKIEINIDDEYKKKIKTSLKEAQHLRDIDPATFMVFCHGIPESEAYYRSLDPFRVILALALEYHLEKTK